MLNDGAVVISIPDGGVAKISVEDDGEVLVENLGPEPVKVEVEGQESTVDPGDEQSIPDTFEPDTTIDSGPTGTTNDPTPSFAFSSTEAESSFQCRFDTAAFTIDTRPPVVVPPVKPPVVPPVESPGPKPLKCKKGFHKKKVHGKVKCAKVKKKHGHRKH